MSTSYTRPLVQGGALLGIVLGASLAPSVQSGTPEVPKPVPTAVPVSTGTAAETELFGISLAKPLKVRECPSVPTSYKEADVSFGAEAEAKVSELVVALYQQKLTYGEFAQRRYAISTAAASAARQYREARLLQDEDRQLQAQQLANQQLENSHERMGKLHAGRQLAPAADGALDQRAGPLLIDEHGQYGEHEL